MTHCLDRLTLDYFKLDAERNTAVVTTLGLDKITLDQFTLDQRRKDNVDASIALKWNQASMVCPECKIKYTQSGIVWSESKLKYNQKSYIKNDIEIKYNQLHYIENQLGLEYNQNSMIYPQIGVKYDSKFYLPVDVRIKYNQKHYIKNDIKVKYTQVHYVENQLGIEYNQASMIYPQVGIKYNSNSMIYPQSSIKWNQLAYISQDCKLKYRQVMSINNLFKIKYNQSAMVYPHICIKYASKTMVYPTSKIKWNQAAYISALLKIKYIQGPILRTSLVNYLEIITPQGGKMYPIIEDASFEKGTDIDTAKITIYENVPPYSLCRLIVNYNIILFEGMTMSCPKKGNVYELEIVDYLEHLQPNDPKPGLYLRKYEWIDVPLQNWVSSNKPTENSNIMGLIYMAVSAIPHVFFESYDAINHIYIWQLTGSTHIINEIFEDVALLTKRNSAIELQTLKGWYYDSVNNRLYIRHTDDVSPYNHVTTIPYIWDGPMPIRIGTIATPKATSVISFVSTADFDIPLETLNTYLYSADLEYESSVRGGITYIDISPYRGSGSIAKPANIYVSSFNILKIDEVDSNNVKYSTNGVILQGYGTGAGSVTAGVYRNMNIGGRFIYLEDASIHGEVQATDYVNKYLNEMYLPAQTVTFEAPLDILGVYDNRTVGDWIKVKIPIEDFVEDLRIQKMQVYFKDSIIKITAGDRLFSFEQRLKAIQSANEKYRKHLEDTVEEINLNWNNNIDAGITRDFDFEIKDNVLTVQKLEITFDVSPFVADTLTSSATSTPEGSCGPDEGTTHGHETEATQMTDVALLTVDVSAKTHKHSLSLANMGPPTSTAFVPGVTHKHPSGTLVNGDPSATTTVINSITYLTYSAASLTHTHNQGTLTDGQPSDVQSVISQLNSWSGSLTPFSHTHPSGTLVNGVSDDNVNVIYELLYGNCTAPNCTRTFACGSSLRSVASYNHAHGIIGNTGTPSGSPSTLTLVYNGNSVNVASSTHLHLITGSTGTPSASTSVITYATSNGTTTVGSATHKHTITGDTGVPDSALAEVAGSGHRHTGTTDNNTTSETVSNKDHVHSIGGKKVAEITDQVITVPESDPYTVNSDLQSSSGDWLDCNSMQTAPYGSDNPDLNPDMYLNLSIVNGTIVTPIAGSPFVVDTDDDAEKSGGPVLIDALVNTNGKYKIRATVSNKSEPGHACRCQLAVRLNGRIFVDTILKG